VLRLTEPRSGPRLCEAQRRRTIACVAKIWFASAFRRAANDVSAKPGTSLREDTHFSPLVAKQKLYGGERVATETEGKGQVIRFKDWVSKSGESYLRPRYIHIEEATKPEVTALLLKNSKPRLPELE